MGSEDTGSEEAPTDEHVSGPSDTGPDPADAGEESHGIGEGEATSETDPAGELTDAAAPGSVVPQLDPSDTTWWRSAIFYQIYRDPSPTSTETVSAISPGSSTNSDISNSSGSTPSG